jgi:hypothetical protein
VKNVKYDLMKSKTLAVSMHSDFLTLLKSRSFRLLGNFVVPKNVKNVKCDLMTSKMLVSMHIEFLTLLKSRSFRLLGNFVVPKKVKNVKCDLMKFKVTSYQKRSHPCIVTS